MTVNQVLNKSCIYFISTRSRIAIILKLILNYDVLNVVRLIMEVTMETSTRY